MKQTGPSTGLVIGTVQYRYEQQEVINPWVQPLTYAVGILFFELVTGSPPYNSQAEIAAGHLYHYPDLDEDDDAPKS